MKTILLIALTLCLSLSGYAQKKAKCTDKGLSSDGTLPSIREQGLNVRKNRSKIPASPSTTTIQQLVKAKEETDLDFNKAVTVRGYVAHVKPGEVETCNCYKPDLLDVHIEVVAKEADKDNKNKYVIFEINPKLENKLGDAASLRSLEGHWVIFTGYLTYDYLHRGESYNRKHKPSNWRSTAWEVHPVISFVVE